MMTKVGQLVYDDITPETYIYIADHEILIVWFESANRKEWVTVKSRSLYKPVLISDVFCED